MKRFWSKVDVVQPNECWLWKGAMLRNGYGYFSLDGRRRSPKNIMAHRAAHLFAYGYLTPKLLVCHSCDNPACCNPFHLFEGTHKDNSQDSVRKGRARGNPNPKEMIASHIGVPSWNKGIPTTRKRGVDGRFVKS